MKLKGLTKLALSGVALAAVAATLGTSTYAWYISNDTATINNVAGSTATAATDGSIYAATTADKEDDVWKNTISLASGTDFTAPALSPVTKATSTKTSAYNGKVPAADAANPTDGNFVDKKGAEVTQSGAYMSVNFWLLSRGNTTTVMPSLTVTNTTTVADTLKQSVYALGHLPNVGDDAPADINELFMVDAVNALRMDMDIDSETVTDNTASYTDITAFNDLDVANAANYSTKAGMVSGGDANLYYNDNVAGVNLYGCAATTNAGLSTSVAAGTMSFSSVTLPADKPIRVQIKIWLEGTDNDCYDSACGQNFGFVFKFVKTA